MPLKSSIRNPQSAFRSREILLKEFGKRIRQLRTDLHFPLFTIHYSLFTESPTSAWSNAGKKNSYWGMFSFRGHKWDRVKKSERRQFLKNAYRVLLTRARQGMVICVPNGNPDDKTRLPAVYNATYDYLREIGIPEI